MSTQTTDPATDRTADETQEAATPVMVAYDLAVTRIDRLGPSFLRLTFGGDLLDGFDPGGEQGPRDMRIKLLVPRPGQVLTPLGPLDDGWYQQWLAQPEDERGAMRTYTVRRATPDGQPPELVIDFVVHVDEHGHQGPGSDFASRAVVGDRLTVLGPYRAPGAPSCADEAYGGIEFRPPAPGTAAAPVRLLLAGDETAVPALCSVLETLPEGYTGHAVIEVPTARDRQEAPSGPGGAAIDVTWLERGDAPHGEKLYAAVRDLLAAEPEAAHAGGHADEEELADVDVDEDILWETPEGLDSAPLGDEPFYAWLAGEAGVIKDLRRLLVREHGVDRHRVAFMGYWRRGRAEG